MKRVAKLILSDTDNKYLLLRRSNHPFFPYDPDLPGGTLEMGEEPILAIMREVSEEIGVTLDARTIEKAYESSAYDEDFIYYLYVAKCERRPDITLSWEHDHYEWLTRDEFASTTHAATDKYMRMVYDYLSRNSSRPTS